MTHNKTKNKRMILKVFPVLFLVAALAVCVFRILLLFNHMDSINGLYYPGSEHLGRIFGVSTMVLFVACFFTGFAAKRFAYPRPIKNESVSAAIAASLCALMLLALLTGNIYDIVKGIRPFGILLGLESVLCLPASGYFFYICSHGAKIDPSDPPSYNLLPLFPALYLVVRTITLFIDTTTQINASQRSFVLLTLICLMMFFVTEAEFTMPHLLCKTPEAEQKAVNRIAVKYYVLGLAVSFLVLAVIASYATAQAYGFYSSKNILYSMMDLLFGLYATVRIFSI